MDIKQLRTSIRNFRLEDGDLGSQGYEQVLLQIFGYSGHGKSSFINSCKYVLQDTEGFKLYAPTGAGDQGMTMKRNGYKLTDAITMVDNRGCSQMNDFEKAEVYAQLGNFLPINQDVVWKENFRLMMPALEDSESNSNSTDFIVPIFVFSARQQIRGEEMEAVKIFLDNCVRMTGIVPIIVLTFKTSGDFLENEKTFRQIGAETVIAIENYTPISNIKTLGRTLDILMVIDNALRNVKFCLEQPRDPNRDRAERKKFLLNYIHQIISKKEIEERTKDMVEQTVNPAKKQSTCAML